MSGPRSLVRSSSSHKSRSALASFGSKLWDATKKTGRILAAGLPALAFACGGSATSTNGDGGPKNGHTPDRTDAEIQADVRTTKTSDGPSKIPKDADTDSSVKPKSSPALIAFKGISGLYAPSDIFTANEHAENLTNVTDSPGFQESKPAWSPDGTRIAVAGERLRVIAYPPDGSEPLDLAPFPARNPSWSPDGSQIAFAYVTQDGFFNEVLAVVNSDGSGEPVTLYQTRDDVDSPAWSPRGDRIAFILNTIDYRTLPYGIYLINPNGTDLTSVLELNVNSAGFEGVANIAWSHDASRILFTKVTSYSTGTDPRGIFAITVEPPSPSAEPELITASAKNGSTIALSPDGTRIMFTVEFDGPGSSMICCDIKVVNTDGSGETMFMSHSDAEKAGIINIIQHPAWYPVTK